MTKELGLAMNGGNRSHWADQERFFGRRRKAKSMVPRCSKWFIFSLIRTYVTYRTRVQRKAAPPKIDALNMKEALTKMASFSQNLTLHLPRHRYTDEKTTHDREENVKHCNEYMRSKSREAFENHIGQLNNHRSLS